MTSGDVAAAQIRTLLARAYLEDPLTVWIFPDEDRRLHGSAAWLGPAVERYLARGRVAAIDEDGTPAAVALFRLPGDVLATADDVLPTASGMLQAVVGAAWAAQVAEGFGFAREQAPPPETPHAYLNFLAVGPGKQRRGHGGKLLERVKAQAAEVGVPLRLETTNPVNLPFYEAHGLRVRSEVRLGPSGPLMWALESGSGSMAL